MNYFNLTSDDDGLYDFWSNTSSLALNFKGLGLPTDSFSSFTNLLAVAAKGQSTCITKAGGYCALLNPCEDYQDTGLWDYDFRIQFYTVFDDNYIRVPLASFAANSETLNGQCVIYV